AASPRSQPRPSWQQRGGEWQRAGSGGRELPVVRDRNDRRLEMSTTKIEDQLHELRRRADRLQALAGETPEHTGIWRHVHAVRRQEAAVLTGARETPDAFDEKLGQLKTR